MWNLPHPQDDVTPNFQDDDIIVWNDDRDCYDASGGGGMNVKIGKVMENFMTSIHGIEKCAHQIK